MSAHGLLLPFPVRRGLGRGPASHTRARVSIQREVRTLYLAVNVVQRKGALHPSRAKRLSNAWAGAAIPPDTCTNKYLHILVLTHT